MYSINVIYNKSRVKIKNHGMRAPTSQKNIYIYIIKFMSKYLIGWGYRYSRIFPPLTYSRQNQPRFPLSPYPSQIKENNANPIDYVNQH
jgi:hypothetical protein